MDRRFFCLAAPAFLAGCSTKKRVFADQSDVVRAFAPNAGPPRLEIFSSFNVGSAYGAHSAMFIHTDQSVVFDPAGTFAHSTLPEQHDVIYGMRPAARQAFIDYHTRATYWTTMQTFEVPAQTAAFVMQEVRKEGPVADALCTRSITSVLARAPGMPYPIKTVWFPDRLHDQLLDKPGVTRLEFRQSDDADKEKVWETATL